MSGSPQDVLADGVVVVGAGLIGTSVGLALRAAGVTVTLRDVDPARAQLAADLGAGQLEAVAGPQEAVQGEERGTDGPALVIVAVPPASVAQVIVDLSRRYLTCSFTDVASVKSQVQVDVERLADASGRTLTERFVGGHPMAGRERSGAAVARADLFEGRPWVLTPSTRTTAQTYTRAAALVEACGADLVRAEAGRHDQAVALVSHAPQVVASLMAARLVDADADLVGLAGQGVRDVTRIAASDAELWTEILATNAGHVRPVLDALAADLDTVRAALGALAPGDEASLVLTDLLQRGALGRSRLPGKHGGRPTTYTAVTVVVTDQPGELARLFAAADRAGVNVEDVSIEHAAGHPVGVVELMVRPDSVHVLADGLRGEGWNVHA